MTAASISAVDMFNILRAKIGEQEAQALTDYVATEVTNRFEAKKEVLATKEDIHKLDLKIEQMKSELAKRPFM